MAGLSHTDFNMLIKEDMNMSTEPTGNNRSVIPQFHHFLYKSLLINFFTIDSQILKKILRIAYQLFLNFLKIKKPESYFNL